jgi:hypothetical protein
MSCKETLIQGSLAGNKKKHTIDSPGLNTMFELYRHSSTFCFAEPTPGSLSFPKAFMISRSWGIVYRSLWSGGVSSNIPFKSSSYRSTRGMGRLMSRNKTNLHEGFKRRVVRHLVVNAVRRNGVVGYIVKIRVAKVERSVEDGLGDAPDPRVLLALYLVQLLDEATVVRVKVRVVVEHVFDKLVEPIRRHYRWVCIP